MHFNKFFPKPNDNILSHEVQCSVELLILRRDPSRHFSQLNFTVKNNPADQNVLNQAIFRQVSIILILFKASQVRAVRRNSWRYNSLRINFEIRKFSSACILFG